MFFGRPWLGRCRRFCSRSALAALTTFSAMTIAPAATAAPFLFAGLRDRRLTGLLLRLPNVLRFQLLRLQLQSVLLVGLLVFSLRRLRSHLVARRTLVASLLLTLIATRFAALAAFAALTTVAALATITTRTLFAPFTRCRPWALLTPTLTFAAITAITTITTFAAFATTPLVPTALALLAALGPSLPARHGLNILWLGRRYGRVVRGFGTALATPEPAEDPRDDARTSRIAGRRTRSGRGWGGRRCVALCLPLGR